MAWNPPGKQPGRRPERDGARDPWRGGPGTPPPGLDDVLRRLNDFFGNGLSPWRLLLMGLAALAFVYGSLGLHRVRGGEAVLVLRGGRLLEVQAPGLHWNPPLLDVLRRVDVGRLRQAVLTAEVLTAGEDLASVSLTLRYRITDARRYVLGFAEAEAALLRVAEAVLQEQAAAVPPAALAAGDRSLLATLERETAQRLARYDCGLALAGLSLTAVRPPPELRAADDDLAAARAELALAQARAGKEAQQAHQQAQAEAARLLAEAARQQAQAVLAARQAAQRFGADLAAYRAAPQATRERLYAAAVADVLARTRTVVVGEGGLQALGIPAEKLRASPLPPPAGRAP